MKRRQIDWRRGGRRCTRCACRPCRCATLLPEPAPRWTPEQAAKLEEVSARGFDRSQMQRRLTGLHVSPSADLLYQIWKLERVRWPEGTPAGFVELKNRVSHWSRFVAQLPDRVSLPPGLFLRLEWDLASGVAVLDIREDLHATYQEQGRSTELDLADESGWAELADLVRGVAS